jgi:hypothetical protein
MRKYRPFPRDLTLIGRRCGFYIRSVRNNLIESREIWRLGLDLDCSLNHADAALDSKLLTMAASRLNEASQRPELVKNTPRLPLI